MDAGGEEESRVEYPCPFCFEDFDIVGMCCHVDEEHPVEAKNGICPVCQIRFGTELVAHVTMEHGNFLKMQRRKRSRKGSSGTQSAISFFRKDLREGTLQSLLGGSSYTVAPTSSAADPLLSSFISLPMDSLKEVQPELLDEVIIDNKISDENIIECIEPSLSEKDQEERGRRSEFAQGLLMSTIFDDTL